MRDEPLVVCSLSSEMNAIVTRQRPFRFRCGSRYAVFSVAVSANTPLLCGASGPGGTLCLMPYENTLCCLAYTTGPRWTNSATSAVPPLEGARGVVKGGVILTLCCRMVREHVYAPP
jgi:hypothetical protein